MGSEVLSRPISGFMIFIYLVTSIITVIIAVGSLAAEKDEYVYVCNSSSFCSPFVYVLPAIATTFSFITLILAFIQARLYHTRGITGVVVLAANAFSTVLWLVIIGIGWSPISASYDYSTGYSIVSVTGWFIWTSHTHGKYEIYSAAGVLISSLDTAINFSFGLLVMTLIIFSLSFIMAVIGLVVYMQDTLDRERMGNWAASITGNTSKGPAATPMGKDSMSMSSV